MQVFIALGSNMGDCKENILRAVHLLEERVGNVISLSALYETAPVGFASQHRFQNAALCLDTDKSPFEVLALSQIIEVEMGRETKTKDGYSDRPIDLDLIFYGDEIIETDDLVVPHRLMHLRRFVLKPMADIAPGVIHPVLQKTVAELLTLLDSAD